MTDQPRDQEPTAEELGALAAVLSDPALWAEPSPEVEDRLLVVLAEEGEADSPSVPDDTVVPLAGGDRAGPRSERRARSQFTPSRWRRAGMVTLAAAAVVTFALLAGGDAVRDWVQRPDAQLVLAGGDYAPDATAVARIDEEPNGVRIDLRVTGLAPAPPGTFYAAWVVPDDSARRVGIGSFHMRGGEGSIQLWSGVELDDYPVVSVTLQQVSDPSGPGQPVLRGRLGP